MTRFTDNIYTGAQAITSATSSKSPVMICKTHRFPVGVTSSTISGTFPIGTQNLDAKLYILAQGSAATSDKITVSAGGTNLLSFTSFGSAIGIVRQTTTSLGTYAPIASACAVVAGAASAELAYSVTLLSVDAAADYQLQLMFSRAVADSLGNAG